MPPARSRAHDDSRSEASAGGERGGSSRDKHGGVDKRRMNAAASTTAAALGSQEKGVGATNANGTHAHEGIEGMGWDDIDIKTLHKYRHAYRLNVPSASGGFNNIVLSSGIGKKTPSRAHMRISRETLATAVRKNFNAQPIQENDVIVNFLYSVKNQDKHFRLRFPPMLGKKHES
ncbi:hypothetical protein RUND412_002636 [Rhizina undulata]